MKLRLVASVAMLLMAALAPLQASAATKDVAVRGREFAPRGLSVTAGDEVKFTVFGGEHKIEGYENATFDSGLLQPGQTYTFPYTSGEVKYRCTFPGHSELNTETGVCTGMCGVLSDSAPTVTAPTITSPANDDTISAPGVQVSGSVTGSVAQVRIEREGVLKSLINLSGSSWTSQFIELGNGSHTLDAIAIHAEGYESPKASVTFTVSAPDAFKPTVEISQPNNSELYSSSPVTIRGYGDDAGGIASFEYSLVDALGQEIELTNFTCTHCGDPTESRAPYTATQPLLPGLYTFTITATDNAAKVSDPKSITFLAI